MMCLMKGEKTMNQSSLTIRRITISAVCLSIAIVIKTAFSFYIPMFGENGMRIGLAGVFTIIPSLLFGPVYGACVSGLSDLIGYLIKPTGAYIPVMTLVVALGGFARGALWMLLKKRDARKMRIFVGVCSVLLLAAGIYNGVCLAADGINNDFYARIPIDQVNTDNMHLVSRMLITRTIGTKNPGQNLATYLTFVTSGVIGSAVLGLLLLAADLFLSKKMLSGMKNSQISHLLIAMIASGLLVTTLNTVILRETIYPSWKLLPFSVIWIPRVIEELLSNTVKAYFVAVLLGVLRRNPGLNADFSRNR